MNIETESNTSQGIAVSRGEAQTATVKEPSSVALSTGDDSAAVAQATMNSYALSTGFQSHAKCCSTRNCIAASLGRFGTAQGNTGDWLILAYIDRYHVVRHVRSVKVGSNGIKPNIAYTLNSKGDFVAVCK